MDLQTDLPLLLPKAIAWAEAQATEVKRTGCPLNDSGLDLARKVGVGQPEHVRVAVVKALPMPDDPGLRDAAQQMGLLGPNMHGLTLGYSVFICQGHETTRLLSHELRHVYQYEQAGSIAAFLRAYLPQVIEVGYSQAPFELDAKAHEGDEPTNEPARDQP